jgi:hypothetical protein
VVIRMSLPLGRFQDVELQPRDGRRGERHLPALLPEHWQPIGPPAENVAAFELQPVNGYGGGLYPV